MAKLNTIQTCTCCGSDVTAPQFFEGKIYGYTCITKVAPAAKRTKTKYVAVEGFKMLTDGKTAAVQPFFKAEGVVKAIRLQTAYADMTTITPEVLFSGGIMNAKGKNWLLVEGVLLVEEKHYKSVLANA